MHCRSRRFSCSALFFYRASFGLPVVPVQGDIGRTKITDAVYQTRLRSRSSRLTSTYPGVNRRLMESRHVRRVLSVPFVLQARRICNTLIL